MSTGIPNKQTKQLELVARIVKHLAGGVSNKLIADAVSELGPEAVQFVKQLPEVE